VSGLGVCVCVCVCVCEGERETEKGRDRDTGEAERESETGNEIDSTIQDKTYCFESGRIYFIYLWHVCTHISQQFYKL
jgi:hypothetical protein